MGARDELLGDAPEPPPPLPRRSSSASTKSRRNAAGQDLHLVRAAGAGSAAHRAADRRSCPFVSDSRQSCATDGGTAGPFLQVPWSALTRRVGSPNTGLSSAWLTTFVNRRRRNIWWKCLRSYPILLCTGMWSRTSTFQFLIVVVVGTVFKISSLDRFQQRFAEQITWKIHFRVLAVFKVSSRDKLLSAHSPGAADEAFTVVFRTIPKF